MSAVPFVYLALAAAIPAAFLACIDAIIKLRLKEPALAFSTKEYWFFVASNVVLAWIVIYGVGSYRDLPLATFAGFFAAIFAYPLLLHTKIFTVRGETPQHERSFGPQLVLEYAETLLLPGIAKTIEEKTARCCGDYRIRSATAPEFQKICNAAENYVGTKSKPKQRDEALTYVKTLYADAVQHPNNLADNAAALFYKIEEVGGIRGARFVLKNAK